jgi:hypothetical protein
MEENLANAELIVKCVNTHDQLVDALEKALPELNETLAVVGHDPSVGIDNSNLIATIEAVEAALKSAKQ